MVINKEYNKYSAQACKCSIQYFMGGVRTYDYFADEVSDYKMPIETQGGQAAYQKTCYDMYFQKWGAVHEQCYEGWAVTTNDQCFEGGKTARYDVDLYDSDEINITYYFAGLERWGGRVFSIDGVSSYYFSIPINNCLMGATCPSASAWFDYLDEIKTKYVGQQYPNDKIVLRDGVDTKSPWRPWYGFIVDMNFWGYSFFGGLGTFINCNGGGTYARQGGQLIMNARVFLMGKETGIGWWDIKELKKFYEANRLKPGEEGLNHPMTLNSPLEEIIHTKGTAKFQDGKMSRTSVSSYHDSKDVSAGSILGAGVEETVIGDYRELRFNAPNRYNKCKNRDGSDKAPWIRVDIPDLFPYTSGKVTFSQVENSMDFGIGPGSIIDPQSNYYHMWRVAPDPYGESTIIYRKKAVEKMVMAPYFVFIKSPTDSSSTAYLHKTKLYRCAVGEVLTSLGPGIYYFPNPCYCLRAQKDMAFFGSEIDKEIITTGKSGVKYPISNASEFFKYFPDTLPLYCDPSEANDEQIKESLFDILGVPWNTESRDDRGNTITTPAVKAINMEYSSEINPYVGLEYLIQQALFNQ